MTLLSSYAQQKKQLEDEIEIIEHRIKGLRKLKNDEEKAIEAQRQDRERLIEEYVAFENSKTDFMKANQKERAYLLAERARLKQLASDIEELRIANLNSIAKKHEEILRGASFITAKEICAVNALKDERKKFESYKQQKEKEIDQKIRRHENTVKLFNERSKEQAVILDKKKIEIKELLAELKERRK